MNSAGESYMSPTPEKCKKIHLSKRKIVVSVIGGIIIIVFVAASLLQSPLAGKEPAYAHMPECQCQTTGIHDTRKTGKDCSQHLENPLQAAVNGSKSKQPRVLCMIFTTVGGWDTKAKAVNNTWGKRCFKTIFFYSKGEKTLEGAVALGVPEGRGHLTAKTRLALEWSYYNYEEDIDWFLKADDDVYIIMENLLHHLKGYDPRRPYYIGKNSGPWHQLNRGYCSGGAGYLLSNKAAGLLLDKAQADMENCRPDGAFEDADIGICLASMSIYPENSLDEEGRLKFHSDNPLKVLEGRDPGYFIKIYDLEFGSSQAQDRMMSPDAISFHYISPPLMYMYDYLLYDVRRH